MERRASAGRKWRREACTLCQNFPMAEHPTAAYMAKDTETSTLTCLLCIVHGSRDVRHKLSSQLMSISGYDPQTSAHDLAIKRS